MRTARALNSIISILFFALGVLLFFFTEKIYKISCEIYENCNHILPFYIHGYAWIALFSFISLVLHVIGRRTHGSKLQVLNILAAMVLFILVVHIIDLYVGSLFCHAWGCTYTLPTWNIFNSPD